MSAPYAPPWSASVNALPASVARSQNGGNLPAPSNPLQAQMAQALIPEQKPTTHDVTVVTTKKLAQAKTLGVPPEEFGIERCARDIKTCNYCFHEVVTKTESELIAEGFDEDQIKALGDYNGNNDVETLSRDSAGEHFSVGSSSSSNTAARLVKITEHYVRMDYEGNGRACLYMVVTGGEQGEILKRDGQEVIEPIDVIPFAATTPVPITHRFFGRSIADLVMPAQREKTAMKRGMLDNIYLSVNPRVVIPESAAGPNTLDDLLVSRPGGIVRTKGEGLEWQVVPNITAGVFPMLQYVDAELEARTGLAKQSQGLDANALQNQSATAVAQVFSASQMRVKLIARIMAEGVRDIFALMHHTIRSHGQEQQTVRLRNKWVPVDPRNWKTRDDMTINVGLGSGGKAQQFAQTMAIANFQKELLLGGKANLVDDKALYNTGAELIRITGHKNPDKFLNDPEEKGPDGQLLHPPVPPPPDPKLEQIKLQAQTDQLAAQQKADIEKLQAQADIATQDKKTQAEMTQTEREFDLKAKLALMQAQLDAELKAKELELKEREFDQKMAFEREKHQMQIRQAEYSMATSAQQHEQTMQTSADSHDKEMARTDQQHKATMEQKAADGNAKKEDHKAKLKEREAAGEDKKAETKPAEDLAKKVDDLAKNVAAVEKAAKAPRKRTLVRGKDGKPSHTIETIVDDKE